MNKTEEFIQKSKLIHNNKYDYFLVEYINSYTKVKIICPEHGIFEQQPSNHLSKNGCKSCGYKKQTENNEAFLIKANITHKNKFWAYYFYFCLMEFSNKHHMHTKFMDV